MRIALLFALLAATGIGRLAGAQGTVVPSSAQATPEVTHEGAIVGNAFSLIDEGPAGEVSVVATGRPDGPLIWVIARNNTDRPLVEVSVTAVARTADGRIFAVGDTSGAGLDPNEVPPGGVAYGEVYFDGVNLPTNVELEFEAGGKNRANANYTVKDFAVTASLIKDRVVGEVRNNRTDVPGGVRVAVMCLEDDGKPVYYQSTSLDPPDGAMSSGEVLPFQVSVRSAPSCEFFLVVAQGFNY